MYGVAEDGSPRPTNAPRAPRAPLLPSLPCLPLRLRQEPKRFGPSLFYTYETHIIKKHAVYAAAEGRGGGLTLDEVHEDRLQRGLRRGRTLVSLKLQ